MVEMLYSILTQQVHQVFTSWVPLGWISRNVGLHLKFIWNGKTQKTHHSEQKRLVKSSIIFIPIES